MSRGVTVSLRPERLYSVTNHGGQLSVATGLESEVMHTFMHDCLLHALNRYRPDGVFLLMHYQ